MNSSEFFPLVKKCRSIRKFNASQSIPRALLDSFIELTRYCPSSMNRQVIKYYISNTPNSNDSIRPLTRWAAALPDYTGPSVSESPSAYIVMCTDEKLSEGKSTFLRDIGIAAQTIMLAASCAGLGGCMIGSFDAGGIRRVCSLPPNIRPDLILALGHPAEEPITEDANGDITYYRDNSGLHHVPKRTINELILN